MVGRSSEALLPIDVEILNDEVFVVCCRVPRTHLKEPFFIDSLHNRFEVADVQQETMADNTALVRPLSYRSDDSRIERIRYAEFLARHIGRRVEAELSFIFHMSRCGSTFLCQLLASSDRFYVLSEPTIANAILDPERRLPDHVDRFVLLKAAVCALAECAPTECERIIIKFRSWNTLFLNEILEQFPEVEWTFVHRHGEEVFPSVLEKPPGWLRNYSSSVRYLSSWLGDGARQTLDMSKDEAIARILGVFCRIPAETRHPGGRYISYESIQNNFVSLITSVWKISLLVEEKVAMEGAARIYSKDLEKTTQFVRDSISKRRMITPTQRQLIRDFVEVHRERLL